MSTPELFNSPTKWGKLWLHESERVYSDRLVSTTDLETFNKAAVNIAKKCVFVRRRAGLHTYARCACARVYT